MNAKQFGDELRHIHAKLDRIDKYITSHGHGAVLKEILDRVSCIEGKVGELMSAISDFATKMKAHQDKQDKAIDGLKDDIKALNDKITELQNSPGTITPADQALLDEIEARGKAAADKADALDALTPPPVPPTP